MAATFSTKPELLLSRSPRGFTATLDAKATRISDAAGHVLSVLKGQTLDLNQVTTRLGEQKTALTASEIKMGLLELLRLELVEQNVVVEAPRWTQANRPNNRLAPPAIAPVTPVVAVRKVPVVAQARLEVPEEVQGPDYVPVEPTMVLPAHKEPRKLPTVSLSPAAVAVVSFSVMMLLGLPIWRVILRPAAPTGAVAELAQPRR